MNYNFSLHRFTYKTIALLLLIGTNTVFSQMHIPKQSDRLQQYLGSWVSSIDYKTDSVANLPLIKMNNYPKIDHSAMSVEVLQWDGNSYKHTLTELIGHDTKTDSIFALGKSVQGDMFLGAGEFTSDTDWIMKDRDFTGKETMTVSFDFKNQTDVYLKGVNPQNELLWQTRYIKKNPKDKNIGIQLVSVHEQMQKNPKETLKFLDRMGYSYIETFVYKDRSFYGLSPLDFKKLVEDNHLKFTGSMTFYDLPSKDQQAWKKAMKWWKECIEDHKQAGVEYLTISNNQIKEIKTLAELKRYAEYYTAIGKLCKERGIRFAYHNHSDEFKTVENKIVYDYLLENTDPEYVSFQADLYWMHFSQIDPIDYFKKYEHRFISWHVKDYKELGQSGKMDFERYFEYAETAGVNYIVAEVEAYNYPVWYSINAAWNYLYFNIL
ncbi:sugar phosphate isomerase/epimerase [Cellulophaga sp. E16_2]|uniref:sugar phosphate isomerase/epimerase family protein n=1 Tax=Cellulophaga sp. E16_2 TaxID=2789297 RepID=UPI001A90D915|nr:sugar phosphate isomerase/epimerase [Cellulophaga sp. E16_2]MBO0589962.1 sugar phosphate isomerase/epimerase [Cellulophaga sp. E16_2]